MNTRDTTATVTTTLHELLEALQDPPEPGDSLGTWRWRVRKRMAAVRDLLTHETTIPNGWLAARGVVARRARDDLLTRLNVLSPRVMEDADVREAAQELRRLAGDAERHFQRLHDLAYDEVELELGGSE